MKWFSGDIASAVTLARTRNAIFVVYCEGHDENSKQMTELIDNELVTAQLESESFVAIKVQSDKEEYMQFAKIYQLVPVPSIFFIKNGVPIKIVTSAITTVAELQEAIETAIKHDPQSSSSQQVSPSSSAPPVMPPVSSPTQVPAAAEEGVRFVTPKESGDPTQTQPDAASAKETEDERQDKIRKAMKLIELKRIEKIKEEQRLEREKEIQRRKEGQDLITLQKWKEDQEIKQIKDDQKREKDEAKAARQRVLDQIEQDKKERAKRFATQSSPTEPKASPMTPPKATTPTAVPNSSRIQFKKPNGDTEIVTFDSGMMFADLHLFVKNDILQGSLKEFTLATAFPRREFSQADFDKTLADLNLTPTAVLLIIAGKRPSSSPSAPSSVLPTQTDGSLLNMLGAVIAGLFSPVMVLFGYLKNLVASRNQEPVESANEAGKRKRNEELLAPNEAAKKRNLEAFKSSTDTTAGPSASSSSPTGTIPKSGAYKRQTPSNNIHRLHQNSDSEDEEKKTYNGNSTQQM